MSLVRGNGTRVAFEFVNVLCVFVIDALALAVLPLTTRVTLYAQIAVIVRLAAARQDRAFRRAVSGGGRGGVCRVGCGGSRGGGGGSGSGSGR